MDAKKILKEIFGYDEFRTNQEEIITHILKEEGSKGTLVIMPTGGGKSLTFQIPSIMGEGLSLVISPLISLMKDQVDTLKSKGVKAELLNSNLTAEETKEVLRKVYKDEVNILYVAPERFKNKLFKQVIATKSIDLLSVDEAHCISSWGANFRPSYAKIGGFIKQLKPKKVVALTATANPKVRNDIKESLGIPLAKVFCGGFNREDLHIEIEKGLTEFQATNLILEYYDPSNDSSCGIVYTATRKEAETICGHLKKYSVPAYFYHAGLETKRRNTIQSDWMKNGGIIVSTNAFGMGIDKPDVRFVINYGIPNSIEEWYQEIGRGSRDGKGCQCILIDNGDKTRNFLLQMEFPSENDIYYFGCWLYGHRLKDTLKMTQEKMAKDAGIGKYFAGGCVRYFMRKGALQKIKNGLYKVVDVKNPKDIDLQEYKKEKWLKYEELKELRRFVDSKRDKMEQFCEYFGQPIHKKTRKTK